MLPITLVALVALQAPLDGELARIVRAHETALDSIHSIETEIEVRERLHYDAARKSSSPLPAPRLNWRWYWAKQRPYERVRYHWTQSPESHGDMVLNWDEMSSRILVRWDPNKPAALTAGNQRGIRAIMARGSGMKSWAESYPEAAAELLLSHHLAIYDPELTLSRVLSESSQVTWRREAGQYVVRAKALPTQRASQGGEYEFYIDPAAHYMVRRREIVVPQARIVCEVTSFRECENGVSFPERVRREAHLTSVAGPFSVQDIVCLKLRVNERLTPDTFDLVFPENALVREYDETGNFVKLKLWGKNNSPQRTFASWQEVDDYAGVRVEGSNPRQWLWTGACAALVTVLVALALRHRFKTRRQPG